MDVSSSWLKPWLQSNPTTLDGNCLTWNCLSTSQRFMIKYKSVLEKQDHNCLVNSNQNPQLNYYLRLVILRENPFYILFQSMQ